MVLSGSFGSFRCAPGVIGFSVLNWGAPLWLSGSVIHVRLPREGVPGWPSGLFTSFR